ncbi:MULTISPECIES: DUF6058 family natural product biosynthesis protein [Pseudoalteromonas]|uniref:DUF6058 family natural product biosynthesis protein n=1 Tax=Pseudoalteromonas TaxID=53246 RepID=UPI0004927B92|nr:MULTISPECIES: DUF6058 family natural product biosynthesis protein [Pseudoalteromonas]AUJ71974.1 hypothetical protein PNC201_18785 [Pseudoalteromonas sp. NC201]MBR8843511.1 hypothetical protein [Pseudoalteromonas sp. JC3]MCF2826268.1 DUF6058 family natural product biosynthesis protein [Pseudoalteromonas sp. OF5H-5]MCF2830220.1 DUF6058 family natural product biosynthesis protein [Pseudoalteromonas sp. DL2-H6]MCF2925464.1 DUF6058 family natural product biosynthesis protein [Pseudoalteromonas s
MGLTHFLNTHFYTTLELSSSLKIPEEQLLEWQQMSLFPNPSYSIQNQIKCSSYFGLYECEEYTDFYARGLLNWGQLLLKHKVDQSSSAFELFQQRYCEALTKCIEKGFYTEDPSFSDDLTEHVQQVWQQFLCGKYGVISQNGLVEEALYIDLGRAIIDDITEARTASSIAPEQRIQVHSAMKLLNKALAANTQAEQTESLRTRYIDQLISKYDLSIK